MNQMQYNAPLQAQMVMVGQGVREHSEVQSGSEQSDAQTGSNLPAQQPAVFSLIIGSPSAADARSNVTAGLTKTGDDFCGQEGKTQHNTLVDLGNVKIHYQTAKELKDEEEEQKANIDDGPKVSFARLFHYATALDYFLILIGVIAAMGNGAAIPVFTWLFKDLVNGGFGGSSGTSNTTVMNSAFQFLYFAIALMACGTVASGCLLLAAARQGAAIRRDYLRSILRQDVGWFDITKTGEITTSIERDCANVQGAIGEKVAIFVQDMTTFLGGIAIGFYQGWQVALVIMGAMPIIIGAGGWMAKNLADFSKMGERAYRGAGGVAEQAISGIRTVASLSGENREKERYSQNLNVALEMGIKKARAGGIGFGTFYLAFFGSYALGLWFSSWLMVHRVNNVTTGKVYTGGDVIMILFCIVMASFHLGQIGPAVQAFAKGQASARRIFDVIERVPVIDVRSNEGQQPDAVRGDLALRGVRFTYPARPDAQIFENLTLEIRAGTTVALVGGSGSGKSTVIQLVMRFYDPMAGTVLLDGQDLRSLNVRWLRRQLGLVSQEPILFAASVADNVRYGKPGATAAEVEAACVQANAHSFIDALPDRYETLCGQRGTQMSGGQKQRIAIARAIISDPKVLLLDEATSALDTESEKIVQAALESVMAGRTVVVVAHRLSTIRGADKIVVFRRGVVVEEGRHDELVGRTGGTYAELVAKQMQDPASSNVAVVDMAAGTSVMGSQGDHGSLGQAQSVTKVDIEATANGEDKPGEGKTQGKGYVRRAFELNRPEMAWGVVGVLGATMNGALFPVLATLLVEVLTAFFICIVSPVDTNLLKSPNPAWVSANSLSMTQTFYDKPDACRAINEGGVNCVWNATGQWVSDASVCDHATTLCLNFFPPGGSLKLYEDPNTCYKNMTSTIDKYCLGFFGLAIAALVANLSQLYSFGKMGEHLTLRLRQLTFAAILRQDIGFFDMEENSVGALCTKLAKDASYVEGAVGTTLGLAIQNTTLVIISLVIAFVRGWMLTLICLATFPLMIVAQILQFKFIAGAGGDSNKAYFRAGAIACESIGAVRTVAAFGAEEQVEAAFHRALDADSDGVKRTAFVAGMGQGFAMFTTFFLYFCGFGGGAYLMVKEGYSFQDVMQVFFSVTFMGMGAGQAAALAPDIGKAKPAMTSIFEMIDRQPQIDIESDVGERPAEVRGDIELQGVRFRYPARKDAQIFHGLDLAIPAGKSIALVGSSGSGKSTIIALVQRFYDPQEGAVLLDGKDIRSLNLRWLRRQFGLVSQEPILFATSIAENIRYGKEDASSEEIEEAARQANAHTFVSTLPNGYNTMCGERGTQLSGGQKQRIAIARAIISNPRILLLDEATSALDAQSELVVQAALDSLMAGRTVVVVAHRLSTIRGADKIVVFRQGRVVEEGRHEELLAARGAFAELVSGQVGL